MPTNSEENEVIKKCKSIENVAKYLGDKEIIKNIYLKNKLINFIIKK